MHIPLVDLKANYLSIKDEIDIGIQEIIDTSQFIMGQPLKEFEEEFAKASDMNHCVGVANGTVAVEMALRALGVGSGDEVIVPANTFIGTTESVTNAGGRCVFVDCDEQTMNIDLAQIEKAITKKTKAIIPVHMYGQMVDMEQLMKIAEKHKLSVVEDSAHAHLSSYKGKKPGVISGIATFSFFPAKNLGAFGDAGGIVCTLDSTAKKLAMMRNHGRIAKYDHEFEGYNYRMDALQAKILSIKLPYLHEWTEKRRAIAARYDQKLKKLVGIPLVDPDYYHVYYMYVIRTAKRDSLKDHLKSKGIETGIHYPIPLHLLSAYAYLGHKKGDFPVAEKLTGEILSIPMYPELTEEQQEYIIASINEFFTPNNNI
ncbi:MAG: DegT/DnrJ/EryC1/StrS family aminotransferase [Nanoarchaeota archaeon]